jgi:hypothetical protein
LNAGYQFHVPKEDAMEIPEPSSSLQEASQYLRIAISMHQFSVVNLVRSSPEDPDLLPKSPKAFLVLPIGSAIGVDGDNGFYLPIEWSGAAPEHYDGPRVTCAVTYIDDGRRLAIVVLQDYGSHYERIGFAWYDPRRQRHALEAARLDKLAPTTKGIQTFSPNDHPEFHCKTLFWGFEGKFDWLRDARKTIITLG